MICRNCRMFCRIVCCAVCCVICHVVCSVSSDTCSFYLWGGGLLRFGAEIEAANNRLDQALERVEKMIVAESASGDGEK